MTGAGAECSRCLMDSRVAGFALRSDGFCSFCSAYGATSQAATRAGREIDASHIVESIRRSATGQYDCLVGLSGGLDSSWSLVLAVRLGLRPLVVHMDNGWNSALAERNIHNLVRNLNVDLDVHVMNWQTYRSLMLAFLQSDVIDIELLYDNAMIAVNYAAARGHGLRFIITGSNTSTEGMPMPPGWNWDKRDGRNIRAIGAAHGVSIPRSYPVITSAGWARETILRRIRWINLLDFVGYDREEALETLVKEFGFTPYPHKHYESTFTRFYQGFLLPGKFGVDKRLLHYSNLILAGQISREEAVASMSQDPYPSVDLLKRDTDFFLKKVGWNRGDLERYMARPGRPHDFFSSDAGLRRAANRILAWSRFNPRNLQRI